MSVRNITNLLIELAESGIYSWENIARSALCYMSEDDVMDMAESEGYLDDLDDNQEEFDEENY